MAAERSNYHARRNELARAKGFASYQAQREAQAKARGAASYRAERKARETGAAPSGGRKQITRLGDSTIVETTPSGKGLHVVLSQIAKASDEARVTLNVELRMSDGTRRDTNVFMKGGWIPSEIVEAAGNFGGLDALIADYLDSDDGAMLYSGAPNGPGVFVAGMSIQAVIF